MQLWLKRLGFLLVSLMMLFSGIFNACGGEPTAELKMAPLSQLPPELQRAPANVREAYQFALANKEILTKIPCYCGCVDVGHTSNYMCYIQDDSSASGQVVFDNHAFG